MCAKIIQDRATGILIIPKWTTQPFFIVVLGLLTDTPRVLRASAQNLVHPTLADPRPTTSPTGVTGMQIIRQSLQKLEFSPDIVEIIMHSRRDSTHKQYRVTMSTRGYNFVVKDHVIPCVPL